MNTQVYVGMGGNMGDTVAILNQALEEIASLSYVSNLRCSNYYRTTPVGPIDQPDYVNGVCTFKTNLSPKDLHCELRCIEIKLGKLPKPKDHPRVIDLDFLFYGAEIIQDTDLQIPHPHWNERLFVLTPLIDLTDEIHLHHQDPIHLKKLLRTFPNIHDETVTFLEKPANLSMCV